MTALKSVLQLVQYVNEAVIKPATNDCFHLYLTLNLDVSLKRCFVYHKLFDFMNSKCELRQQGALCDWTAVMQLHFF